jgi:hypothetical protein
MRSTIRTALVLAALAVLGEGLGRAHGQTPYVIPNAGSTGWRGYGPGYSWSGYAPGSSWEAYVPGTGWGGYVPGTPAPTAGPAPAVTQPVYPNYVYVTPTTRQPSASVRRSSPFADGRVRAFREFGSGRPVPLRKPWLPGSSR